jgi:hypothetical protein
MHVSRDIIEKMASGTHNSKEVPLNMTALAELLETCSDTVFSISFHKQPTIDAVKEKLESIRFADLKNNQKVAHFVKELT